MIVPLDYNSFDDFEHFCRYVATCGGVNIHIVRKDEIVIETYKEIIEKGEVEVIFEN